MTPDAINVHVYQTNQYQQSFDEISHDKYWTIPNTCVEIYFVIWLYEDE